MRQPMRATKVWAQHSQWDMAGAGRLKRMVRAEMKLRMATQVNRVMIRREVI